MLSIAQLIKFLEKRMPTQEIITASVENQETTTITRKIVFDMVAWKELLTMATHEYFDASKKTDEIAAKMLNRVIKEYFKDYFAKLLNNKLEANL